MFFLSFVTALNELAIAYDFKGAVSRAEQLSRKALKYYYQLSPPSYVKIGRGKEQLWMYITFVYTFLHIDAYAYRYA